MLDDAADVAMEAEERGDMDVGSVVVVYIES